MIQCIFENGSKVSLCHVTVGALAINDKDEVLLVKRDPSIHMGGKYTIPGGFLDRGEDAAEATLRELKEESGYNGKVIRLIQVNDSPLRPKEDRQNVDLIFLVKVMGNREKHDKEVSDVSWFSEESLPSDKEFAFDHRDLIIRFFKNKEKDFNIPILGKI